MNNRTILLMAPSGPADLSAILAGIIAQREALDWTVRTMVAPTSRLRLRRILEQVKPDGCIVHCGLHGTRYREEDFGRVPVVWMDRDPADLGPDALCVVQDSHRAGRLAAAELLRYADLAVFAFVDRAEPLFWSGERRDAFREEIERAGRPYREFRVSSLRVWRRRLDAFLAALPRPAGVFCATDGTAGEVIEAGSRLGIPIPAELAVVGVDDTEIFCESQTPTLTSVRASFTSAGRAAAQLLARKLANPRMKGAVASFEASGVTRRQSTRRVEVRGASFGKAVEFIRRGAASGVGVDDVAAVMGCSRRRAEMLFHKWAGRTILAEIHAARIELAKRLLADGAIRLGTLHERCGFRSSSTFRRVFTELAGASPRAYAHSVRP